MVPTSYQLRDAPEYGERAVLCIAPRTAFRIWNGQLQVSVSERPTAEDDWMPVDRMTEAVLDEQYPKLISTVRSKMAARKLDTAVLAS